jgi:excisionase family DNA binding protein
LRIRGLEGAPVTDELRAVLATLVADPSRLDAVAPADVPALLGAVAELEARLWVRLQTPTVAPSLPSRGGNGNGADRLLTVDETAKRLGVSRRWVYRRADELPFARRIAGGLLRFSERGLERYQDSRQ